MSTRESTFIRSMAILDKLSEGSGTHDVAFLSHALQLPAMTVRRLLKDLTQAGYTDYDAGKGSYCIGPAAFHFASSLRRRYPLERVARPIMRKIAAAVGETTALYVFLRDMQVVVCVAVEESGKQLQYIHSTGENSDLAEGAGGCAVSTFVPPEQRERLLSMTAKGRRARARGLTEPEIAACRKRGYVVISDKKLPGAICIGAPVFSIGGMVVASIVITIPEHRHRKNHESRLARILMKHTSELSFMLGLRNGN